MSFLFNEILYRPLFNLLIGLYNVIPTHDLGIAIVALTLFIRLLFVPLSIRGQLSQRRMATLQPKIQELQAKHKGDRQALAQAQMALWKEHKVNPLSGCLPVLIQLPILWALYRVFINGVKPENLSALYSFVHNPGVIVQVGFGFLDLSAKNPIMAVIAGLLQAIQSYLAAKNQPAPAPGTNNPAVAMTKQMMYIFPVMITVISWSFPSALVLYWITTTAFAILEQLYIRRRHAA